MKAFVQYISLARPSPSGPVQPWAWLLHRRCVGKSVTLRSGASPARSLAPCLSCRPLEEKGGSLWPSWRSALNLYFGEHRGAKWHFFPFYGNKDTTSGEGKKKKRKKSHPPRSWDSRSVVVSVNWLVSVTETLTWPGPKMCGSTRNVSAGEGARTREPRSGSSASLPPGDISWV